MLSINSIKWKFKNFSQKCFNVHKDFPFNRLSWTFSNMMIKKDIFLIWNFYSNWLFVNMLKSWDSFEKNGCFESETTFKMNLIKWADSSGPRKAWGGLLGKLCCSEQSGPASTNRGMWFKSEYPEQLSSVIQGYFSCLQFLF